MSSISPSCQTLKDEYDACFNSWFTEHYLKGDTTADMCTNLFKKYQVCIKVRKNYLNNIYWFLSYSNRKQLKNIK